MGCVFLGRPLWANSARHDCATPFASAALVLTEQKEKTRCRDLETSLYSVSLLNDEQTPMEFVVHEEAFFDMDRDTATQKMLLIHHQGTAECGHYPYELAKKKAADVVVFARRHKHPLQCTFEKALRVPEA